MSVKRLSFFAGVNGFITIAEGGVCNTTGALFRRNIYRFEKDFKSEFFILFNHF